MGKIILYASTGKKIKNGTGDFHDYAPLRILKKKNLNYGTTKIAIMQGI